MGKVKRTPEHIALRKAVKNFIKAEFAFRLGPHAYSRIVEEFYNEALEELREERTGEPDLRGAARFFGLEQFKQGELTGTRCAVCRKKQFMGVAGITCPNGHGGADSLESPA